MRDTSFEMLRYSDSRVEGVPSFVNAHVLT
jgi:hypothetical protein